MLGTICKYSGILVLLIAILLGSMMTPETNFLRKLGAFSYLDKRVGSRGKYAMGLVPAMHDHEAWGFTEADMPDLTGQTILVTGTPQATVIVLNGRQAGTLDSATGLHSTLPKQTLMFTLAAAARRG